MSRKKVNEKEIILFNLLIFNNKYKKPVPIYKTDKQAEYYIQNAEMSWPAKAIPVCDQETMKPEDRGG